MLQVVRLTTQLGDNFIQNICIRTYVITILLLNTILNEHKSKNIPPLKLHLQDNLTFVDTNWCALKIVSSMVINVLRSFSVC